MNSSAYVGTLEFIFAKSAQASRISKIGLPDVFFIVEIIFCTFRTICRQSDRQNRCGFVYFTILVRCFLRDF